MAAVSRVNSNGEKYSALTNTSGAVQERFVYDPYGAQTVLTASWGSTTDSYNWVYGFQGGRVESATGLYDFGARNYSTTLGRWMEEDPAGYVDGTNLYQAEDSTPASSSDPSGLETATTQPTQLTYRQLKWSDYTLQSSAPAGAGGFGAGTFTYFVHSPLDATASASQAYQFENEATAAAFDAVEPVSWERGRYIAWDDLKHTDLNCNHWYYAVATPKPLTVTAYFSPTASWTLYSSGQEGLLRHEQGHFDITQIFAKQTQAILENVSVAVISYDQQRATTLARNYTISEMNSQFLKARRQWSSVETRYDLETAHDVNAAAQAAWNSALAAGTIPAPGAATTTTSPSTPPSP